MPLWSLALVIAAAGAVGGVLNAFLTDNGFVRWKNETVGGTTVWRPGFLGNILMGAVGAFLSWALYGRYAAAEVVGNTDAGSAKFTETLSSIAGAILIGTAGARFLTAQVDRKLLQVAASEAATAKGDREKAVAIATASPAGAAHIAATMPKDTA